MEQKIHLPLIKFFEVNLSFLPKKVNHFFFEIQRVLRPYVFWFEIEILQFYLKERIRFFSFLAIIDSFSNVCWIWVIGGPFSVPHLQFLRVNDRRILLDFFAVFRLCFFGVWPLIYS